MIRKFLRLESASGLILLATAGLAILLDNSPLAWLYDEFLTTTVALRVEGWELSKPLVLWINDGLMAIFFLLVGLEIKREILEGELSSRRKFVLPVLAATGGVLTPALIFSFVNWGNAETMRGWAIPAATDIAFALGILSLLGKRIPVSLKVFLTAIAIIDDLAAIVIIAAFYTADLSWAMLGGAAVFGCLLIALNRCRVISVTPYVLVGFGLWLCVLKSGVHATLAGVLVALAIPMRANGGSPVKSLEHALHPWVAFAVMPAFAFANAGIALHGLRFADLLAPLPLGIAAGLFFGNQIGIFSLSWIAVRLGLARRPHGTTWGQIYGAAVLAGVGFTMSLFIGGLAFDGVAEVNAVRLGVLAGSFVSAVAGYLVLRLVSPVRATTPVGSSGVSAGVVEAAARMSAGAGPVAPGTPEHVVLQKEPTKSGETERALTV